MSRCSSRPTSASACMADSELPVKQTSDSPQLGRSQISTRLPCFRQIHRQLTYARGVLGEAATGRDDPRPPAVVADELVAQRQPATVTRAMASSPSPTPEAPDPTTCSDGCAARRGRARPDRSVRSRGMPSTRSLMTLRAISVVPPPMLPAWRMRKSPQRWLSRLVVLDHAAPATGHLKAERAERLDTMPLNKRPIAAAWSVNRPLLMLWFRRASHLLVRQLVHPGLAHQVWTPGSSIRSSARQHVDRATDRHRRPSCRRGWSHSGELKSMRSWNIQLVPDGPPVVDLTDAIAVGHDHIGDELLAELASNR